MSHPILLVEDSEDDVLILRRSMHKAGIANPLYVVPDGREAIQYLEGAGQFADRGQFPLPYLVLLDLKLPHVPGFDVLKWIRGQPVFQTLIVVMLTSSQLEGDIDRAYRLGANSFLVKTASPDRLTQMIRLVHDYWLDFNQSPPQVLDLQRKITHAQSNGEPS